MTYEELFNLPLCELVSLWNDCCDCFNIIDSMIYSMDDFEEIINPFSHSSLSRMIFYGDFNPNSDWFMFDGYGNLRSMNYREDLLYIMDVELLLEYCEKGEE